MVEMSVIERIRSLIAQGVYSVVTPFHPFGGAVDIIVVKQQDGSYRSTPWYVRFGKFQGVLKGAQKVVGVSVNDVEVDVHMLLDNSGEAYFLREAVPGSEDAESSGQDLKDPEFFDSFQDDAVSNVAGEQLNLSIESVEEVDATGYESPVEVESLVKSEDSNSEMLLMSVGGHVIKAKISPEEEKSDDVQLSIPKFHLFPGDGSSNEWMAGLCRNLDLLVDGDSGTTDPQNEVDIDRGTAFMGEGTSEDCGIVKSCDDSQDLGSSGLGLEKRVESNCLEETSLIDVKLEGSKADGDSRLKDSDLTFSDIPSSTDIQAVGEEEQDKEHDISDSTEEKNIPSVDACGSDSGQHFEDYEGKSSDMGNSSREGSEVSPFHSLSPEKAAEKSAAEEECNEPDSSGAQMSGLGFEISLCGNVQSGTGCSSMADAFATHRISEDEFMTSGREIIKKGNLIVRYRNEYFTWDSIAHIIIGKAVFGSKFSLEPTETIPIEQLERSKASEESHDIAPSTSRWRLWPNPFRRVKSIKHSHSDSTSDEVFHDSSSCFESMPGEQAQSSSKNLSPKKLLIRTNIPTSEQIASLNLKDGQNTIVFSYSTRVLGPQQVKAHVYLWKWDTKIVISDVDGTITKSDVLGQVMPLVGRDWTQLGVARLFSAIEENGYQLLFLSARAIVQAYITRNFLSNLEQDGEALPRGPVVLSPDGILPSLYREVIRKAPHEFKIACLKDIRALFPSDHNPFYAGFGNRDTDELSYRKVGIPKGKIFIINPKGEVVFHHRTAVKSYTSLHTLVHDMFPPTSLTEQEEFNDWNFWKPPVATVDDDE